MEARAYLTEGIHPDVVQLPSHWEAKQNVNIVMDNVHCAPHVGSTQLRGQLCRVKKKVTPRPVLLSHAPPPGGPGMEPPSPA